MALDGFKEECGLIAVWDHDEAANMAYLGLYAQQHRGQEGAGVTALDISSESGEFTSRRGVGLVADLFQDFDFSELPGRSALGHVRYTTAGASDSSANVQPLYAEIAPGRVAIAHNGNLINADSLREQLIKQGAIFSSTSDTEVILHLLAKAQQGLPRVEMLISALKELKGAFSLLVMFKDKLYAVRDPQGLRPLILGSLDGSYVLASESCAFDLLDVQYEREVEPGEVLEINQNGEIKSYFPFGSTEPAPCIFEYVYFSRPDSTVFGRNVYSVRKRMGVELAKEHPVEADMVIPVPDSGVTAAIGYAQQAGIPLELGLIRNHYIGRTFIEPMQSIRNFGVKIKLNANPDILAGKSIVVVDDSVVRGTTSKKIVGMLRKAGAKEVHLRISSPPTTDPCYYGVDTPQKEDLIASSKSTEQIREFVGADSLGYLSIEGMFRAVDTKKGSMCNACFSGKYPAGTPKKKQAELF